MVEVRMGQQQEVDACRVEAEIGAVLLFQFAAALKHAAVNQKPAAATFEHVAGAGDAAGGAVERQDHRRLESIIRPRRPPRRRRGGSPGCRSRYWYRDRSSLHPRRVAARRLLQAVAGGSVDAGQESANVDVKGPRVTQVHSR
jgi:hypothetical protein